MSQKLSRSRSTAGTSNTPLCFQRAALASSPLVKLPIGSIRPKGWLLGQL